MPCPLVLLWLRFFLVSVGCLGAKVFCGSAKVFREWCKGWKWCKVARGWGVVMCSVGCRCKGVKVLGLLVVVGVGLVGCCGLWCWVVGVGLWVLVGWFVGWFVGWWVLMTFMCWVGCFWCWCWCLWECLTLLVGCGSVGIFQEVGSFSLVPCKALFLALT